MPPLDELEAGVNVLRPGGDTVCSRGTEYMFFVFPGTVNRVVIDFEGGGACWNDATCGFAEALFKEEVNVEDYDFDEISGIYDHENPDNPFRDWTHVYIPYCTGDLHWGDNVQTYGSGDAAHELHHMGAINAGAVLDWVYENIPAPERIFITGCSAGSYGSAGWAPHIMEHYTDVPVVQFGDSGAGVITDSFFVDVFEQWNPELIRPDWITDLADVDPTEMSLPWYYETVAAHYSGNYMSQYNTAFDENQIFYFQAMGGGSEAEWSEAMFASIDQIASATENFRYYIATGDQHCILPYANFYTVETDGVLLRDWVDDLANGETPDDVRCTGTCE